MLLPDASWVRPFWLERQCDPASPDFVPAPASGSADRGSDQPAGAGAWPANRTHRSGTLIGNVATYERSLVDPRGLVTAWPGGWSVDWWIRAEDRWHVPSRAPTVRQALVGDAPVVETRMRVPGGDAVQRVYAMQSTTVGPCTIIEIENRTAVPFAVALAIRPYHPLGPARITTIEADEMSATVDGRTALLFPRAPGQIVFGADGGDAADPLFRDLLPTDQPERSHDAAGRATATFVFPLPHTVVLRIAIPLAPPVAGRRGSSRLTYPDVVPTAEQVAKGWEVQTRRGLRVELPDARLVEIVDTARRHLLLAHGGEDLVTWPVTAFDFADAATVLGALDLYGFHDEAAQVLATWPERQSLDGTFAGTAERMDANGCALLAAGDHWQLTRDDDLIESLVGPLAKGVHWIEKRRTARRARRDPQATGLLPGGSAPSYAGPAGSYLRDAARSVRGLRSVSVALTGSGQPEVGEDAARFADQLAAALDQVVAVAVARGTDGVAPIPPTPGRTADDGTVAGLDLFMPFGPVAPTSAAAVATLDHLRATAVLDRGVVQRVGPAGLSPALTMQLGLVELEAGDPRALDRLAWMVDHAGPTVSWPTTLHPRTGGGATGSPQDPVATALFLTFIRQLLVRETAEGDGLALLTLVPDAWLGQSIDVREAPTAFGLCSFSIRWHGERPALLWEIEPHPDLVGTTAPVLTAPGLDARWSTTAWSGEALLGPVAAPSLPTPALDHDHDHADPDPDHDHADPDHADHDHEPADRDQDLLGSGVVGIGETAIDLRVRGPIDRGPDRDPDPDADRVDDPATDPPGEPPADGGSFT